MKLSLGFSTCPNDTFIFDALVNQRFETAGFEFLPVLADVEELNQRALKQELDITKLSYHAYAYVASNYQILDSGSALGRGNGPLLVSKKKVYPDEVEELKIAIPGKYTTANLLLGIAYPGIKNKSTYLFSDIESVVLDGDADAGILIHETRFTYASRGLKLILDLGQFWEDLTNEPIPLGGIMIHRRFSHEVKFTIQRMLHTSLVLANKYPKIPIPYMKQYAQDMSDDIMRQHVHTFVNEHSLSLGVGGRKAIQTLYEKASMVPGFPMLPEDIFIG